jgi:glycosyltransferase involved in cell wall biosynthesis
MDLPTVSLVIPVLDEEDTLPELHRRVEAALEGIPHELVFVDDSMIA